MAPVTERLRLWVKTHPQRMGRLSIMLGLFLAGALSQLPPPPMVWKEYSVLSMEKISIPHNGKLDSSFRLHTSDGPQIGIANEIAALFGQTLLLQQPMPAAVEVYAEHKPKGGIVWAEGLRLKDGPTLMDYDKVKTALVPDQTTAWLVGGVFIVLGFALQFVKTRRLP